MYIQNSIISSRFLIHLLSLPNLSTAYNLVIYFIIETDDYLKCTIKSFASTLYHPVGSCKMGPNNDKDAVVNSKLKVCEL